MFSMCGDEARGMGSIAGALISVGIVRINGSYCRVCCLFPPFLFPLPLVVTSFFVSYIRVVLMHLLLNINHFFYFFLYYLGWIKIKYHIR